MADRFRQAGISSPDCNMLGNSHKKAQRGTKTRKNRSSAASGARASWPASCRCKFPNGLNSQLAVIDLVAFSGVRSLAPCLLIPCTLASER